MSDEATAPAAFVDLQVHTTASDGALPPAAVVQAAADAALHAIAITDHDTVDGLPEAHAAGERLGVRIVPGVELSTHFEGEELHLLGLHLTDLHAMADALADFRVQRVQRAERIVETLNAHGIPITMDAVLAEAADGAVGRPHIARAMLAGGWVREFREAFDKWIGWGRPAYMAKEQFDVADAMALVHRAGGLAVWAHPGELATPARIARLADRGLDAVEVLHPSHPPYLVQRLVEHTEKAGLLPSGGSDWHGTQDGPRKLGGQLVPKVWLDWQDARVATRGTTTA
ncbi:PHP domain-containing protein [Gemmatimonas sp.]|uniref:PHP domain-containing protein n=1 Tax=Gemmatimonas sp. TaxID=1962908 RepID=UPI0022CB7DC0|nr:PHP domain-containing protein [Gemmatimonas sp.]MCZ8203675.1 PHP domain-containing protein [Gemmatimonas sp.]